MPVSGGTGVLVEDRAITHGMDPAATLALQAACTRAAQDLQAACVSLRGAGVQGLDVGATLGATAAWLEGSAHDLRRRVLVLQPAVPARPTWAQWQMPLPPSHPRASGTQPGTGDAWSLGAALHDLRGDLPAALATLGLETADAGGDAARPAGVFTTPAAAARHVGGALGRTGVGVVGVVGDIGTLLDPPHDGWYGTADRAVAVASLGVTGVQVGAWAGAVALTPVGAGALVVVGVGVGLYTVGSLAWDHRDWLRDRASGAGRAVRRGAGAVGDAAGAATDAVQRSIRTAVDRLGGRVDELLGGHDPGPLLRRADG